jgi:hypothetical protein
VTDWPFESAPALAAHAGVQDLCAQLRARFHDSVVAVLAYGSCLRSGDPGDGLLDLYLICDSYRRAHRHPLSRWANGLLPPNVYFAQGGDDNTVVRAKVALLSLADFRRGCSPQRFESYIWGRFAQPVALLHARDDGIREALAAALQQAQQTLLQRALPALPEGGNTASLWSDALALSYATELRTERGGRAGQLVNWRPDFYRRALSVALANGLQGLEVDADGHYRREPGGESRARRAWQRRRVQGKCLSLLRLTKAFFTFDGGIDYLVWKLERHSGQSIEVPPRVRRLPLLFAWPFFWRLYRQGLFR